MILSGESQGWPAGPLRNEGASTSGSGRHGTTPAAGMLGIVDPAEHATGGTGPLTSARALVARTRPVRRRGRPGIRLSDPGKNTTMGPYSMLPAMMLMGASAIGRNPPDDRGGLPERRRWKRMPAAPVRARIAWRIQGFGVLKSPVRLIDISQGGARIAIEAAAPRDPPFLWVGLRSLPCEWVKARVQEVYRQDGCWVCRLRFLEDPCPGLLEMASAGRR